MSLYSIGAAVDAIVLLRGVPLAGQPAPGRQAAVRRASTLLDAAQRAHVRVGGRGVRLPDGRLQPCNEVASAATIVFVVSWWWEQEQ